MEAPMKSGRMSHNASLSARLEDPATQHDIVCTVHLKLVQPNEPDDCVDASCASWRAQTVSSIHKTRNQGQKLVDRPDKVVGRPFFLVFTTKGGRPVVSKANIWSAAFPQFTMGGGGGKNIVLALIDDCPVTKEALSTNVLIAPNENVCLGKSLAELWCDSLKDFNPMVHVSIEKGDLSSFGGGFYDKFGVVVVSCSFIAKKATAVPWKSLPRRMSKLYFAMRANKQTNYINNEKIQTSEGYNCIIVKLSFPIMLAPKKCLKRPGDVILDKLQYKTFLRLVVAGTREFLPVCAIIGGILGQAATYRNSDVTAANFILTAISVYIRIGASIFRYESAPKGNFIDGNEHTKYGDTSIKGEGRAKRIMKHQCNPN
ncbi:hypothetical protein HYC85_029056 [Camellia sinensis]|uniref:Uncharacterized protein n=1 Tax=Camellia sinensis TaxID=4442 RepID=A0A7J7FX18_CAMSI|nr:hypothetical protein HYC85_029056 [Camellia sinensis]